MSANYSRPLLFLLISASLHALVLFSWQNTSDKTVSVSHSGSLKLAFSSVEQYTPTKQSALPVKQSAVVKVKKTSAIKKPAQQAASHIKLLTMAQAITRTPDPEPAINTPAPEVSHAGSPIIATNENRQLLSARIQKQLSLKIKFLRNYPRIAIRNEWEGRVKLGIRVLSNGQLADVHIVNSSGYRILDNAAMRSINKIASLPEASYWLNGQAINVVLPVIYKLSDS
ncbi:MAG: energy transducer TonB [Gammaproteobacteria bacterium]|nr:energy transducer TonB [Gammaproteobacteria bacterium]